MGNPVTAAVRFPFLQFYLFKILVCLLEHVEKALNIGSYACMFLICLLPICAMVLQWPRERHMLSALAVTGSPHKAELTGNN